MKFDSSDPRWSAYVFDELTSEEAASMKQELESSEDARETVAGLRRAAIVLDLALDNLPPIALSPERKQTIGEAARKARGAARSEHEGSRILTSKRLVAASALAGIVLAVAMAVVMIFQPEPVSARFQITTPPTSDPVSIAISPDGKAIVFAATSGGRPQLFARSLNSTEAQALAGTDSAELPFWSPDGSTVAFFADGKLKKVHASGGPALDLAEVPGARGGVWNQDGTILVVTASGGILQVPAEGGIPTPLPWLTARQNVTGSPQLLPDGRHLLFFESEGAETGGVYVSAVDGSGIRRLLDADAAAIYSPSGQLLFVRQRKLFAQKFDPNRMEMTGAPYLVADGVTVAPGLYKAALSASTKGTIVYRTGPASPQRELVWFDRSGKEISKVGSRGNGASAFAISPDGRFIAVSGSEDGKQDIWVFDAEGKQFKQFTSGTAANSSPVWSADGKWIAFSSNRDGTGDLFLKGTSGTVSEELLLQSPEPKTAVDWSPDGRYLFYSTSEGIWTLPLGLRKPFSTLRTNPAARGAQLSPDGKWLAYESDQAGRSDIYVQPFPSGEARWLVSPDGGTQARWRRDGTELFYIGPDNSLMAVSLRASGSSIEAGIPMRLFLTRLAKVGRDTATSHQYAVSPDGRRFLINTIGPESTSPINVIQNWTPQP